MTSPRHSTADGHRTAALTVSGSITSESIQQIDNWLCACDMTHVAYSPVGAPAD